jgi:hypothetical protein
MSQTDAERLTLTSIAAEFLSFNAMTHDVFSDTRTL